MARKNAVTPDPVVTPAEAPAAEAPAAKKVVKVRPTHGSMWEPFQRIMIAEGNETPVELTSWVDSQIKAGFLELV